MTKQEIERIDSRVIAARMIGKMAGERCLLLNLAKRTPSQSRRLRDLELLRAELLRRRD